MLLGCLAAAALFAWSVWWAPLVHGISWWIVSADTWFAPTAAIYVGHGAFQEVYLGSPNYFALPLSAVLLAPVVRLGQALGLVNGYPYVLPKPTMWLVVGPFTLLLGTVPVALAARAAAWGAGVRKRLWLLQAAALVIVSYPCGFWGHFEDSLATTFLLLAVKFHADRRHTLAALLLGVACCSKQWAVLALPFLLLTAPQGRRMRVAALAVGLPLLLALEPLLAFPHQTLRALLLQPTPNLTALQDVHTSLLVHLGRAADRVGRLAALASAAVVGWWTCRRRPHLWLVGLAVALLVRPLLEPYLLGYYLAPGMLVLALAATVHRGRVEAWVLAVFASPVIWATPDATGSNLAWWAGELVLLGVAAFACFRIFAPRSEPARLRVHTGGSGAADGSAPAEGSYLAREPLPGVA